MISLVGIASILATSMWTRLFGMVMDPMLDAFYQTAATIGLFGSAIALAFGISMILEDFNDYREMGVMAIPALIMIIIPLEWTIIVGMLATVIVGMLAKEKIQHR